MGPHIAAPLQSEGTSTPELIRKQLEKITQNKLFARSERMCRFLRFVVEHALAGTGAEVKEYLVGTQVFDRAADYDPRVDPIVRVEAHRLRSKLKAYYSTAGKSDALVIEFPRGAYLPVFRARRAARAEKAAHGAAKAIAVLPFANLTPEPEGDYFSDGLTEELILLLTRIQGLRVVAWNTASQLRGEQDLRAVRTKLQVDAILRGSVRRGSGRVRVTAQLVDTESGAYLWSEAFDRDTHDVLMIEQEIARAIVDTLRLALSPASGGSREINVDCYNLCLRGRFYAHRRTAEGLLRSVECYQQAIAKDPGSATAHAGLADAYGLLADYGVMPSQDVMTRAEEAAQTALRLDPDSAEAICSLAFVSSLFRWKWDEAENLYRRAIAINPGYSTVRQWYGVDYLALRGRFDEAAEQIRIARSLDPLSLIIHENAAYIGTLRRDYEGAIREFEQLIELDPEFYKGYSGLGRVLSLMGRYDEALALFDKTRDIAGEVPSLLGARGQTLALAGRTEEARQCLDELERMSRTRCVPGTCVAILHLGLGEIDRSLSWLETSCERHETPLAAAKVHPVYDRLRDEPRFQAILRRMGM